jgi:DNA-binding transcriptional LysR family regulator
MDDMKWLRAIENRLQLKDYRLLLAIQRTGQLALAAETLSLTQPAASRMLGRIEQIVGQSLFLRHPKGMTPTPVGEVLARNAFTVLSGLEQTMGEFRAVSQGRVGTARVGAVTGGAVGFMVPAIRELKAMATGAEIHLDVAPSETLIEGLSRGLFDFVLSRIPAGIDARHFTVQRGRSEEVRFLVRRDHPLAGRGPTGLDELVGYEWVIQPLGTPLRKAVEEAFLATDLPLPSEVVNTTSLLVMIAYLPASDAIAPVSLEVADLVGAGAIGSSLVALDLARPIVVNPYHVISRQNVPIGPLAVRLRELVVAALAGTAPFAAPLRRG